MWPTSQGQLVCKSSAIHGNCRCHSWWFPLHPETDQCDDCNKWMDRYNVFWKDPQKLLLLIFLIWQNDCPSIRHEHGMTFLWIFGALYKLTIIIILPTHHPTLFLFFVSWCVDWITFLDSTVPHKFQEQNKCHVWIWHHLQWEHRPEIWKKKKRFFFWK